LTRAFRTKAFPDFPDISLEVGPITCWIMWRNVSLESEPIDPWGSDLTNESGISGSWHGRCLRKMSHFSWFFKGTEELVPSWGRFAGPLTQFPEENGDPELRDFITETTAKTGLPTYCGTNLDCLASRAKWH
jgi:hypothetical protein